MHNLQATNYLTYAGGRSSSQLSDAMQRVSSGNASTVRRSQNSDLWDVTLGLLHLASEKPTNSATCFDSMVFDGWNALFLGS